MYSDEVIKEYNLNNNVLLHTYVYNNDSFIEKLNGKTFTFKFKSDQDGKPVLMSYDYADGKTASAETRYDDLGRMTNQGVSVKTSSETKQPYWVNYLYRKLAGLKSSDQIYTADYTFGNIETQLNRFLSYTYDKNGNITGISKNGELRQSYVYDEAGQLIRVNDLDQNKTFTYQYDAGGNIRVKREYPYTTGELSGTPVTVNYTYGVSNLPGWNDVLASYNGKTITYDEIGNPLTYDGWTYVWEGGRQLKRTTKDGSTIDYKYDDNGIRKFKTVNGVTTNYTLVNGRITASETDGVWTYYRYDEQDNLLSLNWQGNEYFYVKNIQGDIIGLVDEQGNLVVEYAYDAWGKQISCTGTLASTLGEANPFRYRGYYYDTETGLFYVGARYYDPEIGRFINADDPELLQLFAGSDQILATNLFAYALNNPVNHTDPTGEFVQAIVGGVIGAIVGAFTYWLEWKLGMRKWNGWFFAGHIILSAGLGAVGAHFRYWAKFSNLAAKIANKLYLIKGIKAYPRELDFLAISRVVKKSQ